MELQVGVKILLSNNEGKFLLLHRSLEKYPEVLDRWDIVGGRIIPGTPLLENLAREVMEETKLEIKATPRLLAAQDIVLGKNGTSRHVVRLTYMGQTQGEPVLDEDHDSFAWLTMKEIKAMPVGDLDKYLREVLETLT